ncbi:immunity 49 family protein [Tenacibaculum sp. TC6]|uniref:immunity 49 family protein n=1 Tax=Tenacibaculum sp. TC6 TaxID=3423223 RepID=UPI003D35BF6F
MIARAKRTIQRDLDYYQESVNQLIIRNEEVLLTRYENNFNKYANNIGTSWTRNLSEFQSYQICTIIDREKEMKLLHYARVLARAFYSLGYNIDKDVVVRFRDKRITLKGRPYKSYMGIIDWYKALGLFFALRDRAGIDLLMGAPRSAFENSALQHKELHFRILRVVQNIYNPSVAKHMMGYIQEALEATDPTLNMYDVDKGSTNFVLYIREPLIRVWMAALMNKEDYFNEQLEDALLLHKKYYSVGDRCEESDGWVSWRLLAPTIFAHDSGININIESEYIPKWLVEGDFSGVEKWLEWEI